MGNTKKHTSGLTLKGFCTTYFIDALSAMAYGLFASLIVGVIMAQLGKVPYLEFLTMFEEILSAKSPVIGCAIGCAIAFSLKADKLNLASSTVVGAIGYTFGGPVACYLAVCVACTFGKLVGGRTAFDILLVPFCVIISGGLVAKFIGPSISAFMLFLGSIINNATTLQPIYMGIIVAVLMGIFLTAPISSAAIAISLNLSGLAAGAATVGCCAHMIGFAVISYKDNGFAGLLAQGFGTSMLQVPNILRHPQILIPPVLTSAILGPMSTTLFRMENTFWAAGMGTSGLVGPIGTLETMGSTFGVNIVLLEIALLQFILPATLCLTIYAVMKNYGFIKSGYMKLELN